MGSIIGKTLALLIRIWSKVTTCLMLYIDYCDFALVTFVTWLGCRYGANLHSGVSLIIGLAVAALLYWAFKTKIGFWIVSPIFSACCIWIFMELILKGLFRMNFSTLWYWILTFLVFGYNLFKHMYAVDRKYVKADIEAEKRGLSSAE